MLNRPITSHTVFALLLTFIMLTALNSLCSPQPAAAATNSASGATTTPASPLQLESSDVWTPNPTAAPVTRRAGEALLVQGNGTRACCGGWQFVYTGLQPGQAYRIRARARHKDLDNPWDSLLVMVLWDRWDPAQAASGHTPWNFLLPKPAPGDAVDFENTLVPPPGATCLTVRYTLRWTQRGSAQWAPPQIEAVAAPDRKPVKLCIITAPRTAATRRTKPLPLSQGLGLPADVAESVDLYATLALKACERKPQLIVTPEIAIGGKTAVDGSVEVPGPATRPFEKIAREHNVYLVLGMRQRDGDAFYNICALIGPSGKVEGIYRKVHLATSEGLGVVSPGDSFPVFNTKIGRIGCLICMDTMIPESARMLALNGADFICMPIMGDLRADRWDPGTSTYDEDLWKAFMRTRAVDNQLTMVIARNATRGSCVIDRKGDILAWNKGGEEIIEATVPASDGYRSWNGGDFRETTFMLRRPHLYGAFTEPFNLKAVDPAGKD